MTPTKAVISVVSTPYSFLFFFKTILFDSIAHNLPWKSLISSFIASTRPSILLVSSLDSDLDQKKRAAFDAITAKNPKTTPKNSNIPIPYSFSSLFSSFALNIASIIFQSSQDNITATSLKFRHTMYLSLQ